MSKERQKALKSKLQKLVKKAASTEEKPSTRISYIRQCNDVVEQLSIDKILQQPSSESADKLAADLKISSETYFHPSQLKPKDKDTVEGEDVLKVIPYPPKEAYRAVRSYSADTEKGSYARINRFLRGVPNVELFEDDKNIIQEFDKAFNSVEPIKKSVRVYRGLLLSQSRLTNFINLGFYSDNGFTSTSTDLGVALYYSKKQSEDNRSKVILVMDLKKGTKALNFGNLSRNPQEREILLERNKTFPILDVDFLPNDYAILYLTNEVRED